jgi:hypothetical protein
MNFEDFIDLPDWWQNAEIVWELITNNCIRPKNPYYFNSKENDSFARMFNYNHQYELFEEFAEKNIFRLVTFTNRTQFTNEEIKKSRSNKGYVYVADAPPRLLPKEINVRAGGSFGMPTDKFLQNKVQELRNSGFDVTHKDVHESLIRVLQESPAPDMSKCVNPPAMPLNILDYVIKNSIVL